MRNWILALLAGWISLAQAGLFGDDELLPADQAFGFSTEIRDDGRILARFRIADGYYLYKKRFGFKSLTPGLSLGEPVWPPAKVKDDPAFGRVETYRKQADILLPVLRQPGNDARRLRLEIRYQGCADLGVCYPPQKKEVALELPPPSTAGDTALNALADAFSFEQDALLPPDQAFRLEARATAPGEITASWIIAPGYYLYRDKFRVTLEQAPDGVQAGALQLPQGELKDDEFFGRIQVFHEVVDGKLQLARPAGPAQPVHLVFEYQGCAEAGVCYQPITRRVTLELPAAGEATRITDTPTADVPPAKPAAAGGADKPLSEQDAIARRLAGGNMLATLLAFFGFGLLLSFTPCVFPMVPILSSIIVGQGSHITTHRSFILSLVYVLAMAATYTAAGVLAGLSGENLQAAFQNPWILTSFAAVFVILSLSMFGFYDLQMPAFVQNHLSTLSNRQRGGSLTGVAVMGFLSALIVGPCVAAPLAGALIYIGQTGDAVLGGAALFALSMGMGTPLIAIGIGAGKLLPKAGPWMDRVKAVFGVLMLAVSIWLLERVLPGAITLVLWAALFIVSSVYLGALEGLAVEATGWARLWKGLGVLMLAWGVLMLVGAAGGGSNPLMPIEHMGMALKTGGTGNTATQAHALGFKRIRSPAELERELAAAKAAGKPVMLDFYADWCISCKEMEKLTFGDAGVQQALEGFVLLQADVTANNADDKALLKRFGLFGPPGILFFDADGRERPDLTVVGFKKATEFRAIVESVHR